MAVGAVGVFSRFHVLSCYQSQQGGRVGRLAGELCGADGIQQCQCVVDQGRDEFLGCRCVVPGDTWFAGVAVVVAGAPGVDQLLPAWYVPANPADRGNQLCDGVLTGDGIIENGGVQGAPGFGLQCSGGGYDLGNGFKDSVRAVAGDKLDGASTSGSSRGRPGSSRRNRRQPSTADRT